MSLGNNDGVVTCMPNEAAHSAKREGKRGGKGGGGGSTGGGTGGGGGGTGGGGGASGRTANAAFVAACSALCVSAAHGAIVAGWNMNGVDPASATTLTASFGAGTMDFTGFGGNSSALQGTTLGALKTDLAGESLSFAGNTFNGMGVLVSFDSTGFEDLALTFAVRRSTTGFSTNRVEYWDGLGWQTAASFTASTTAWELKSFDFTDIAAIENGFATLRITLDGATGSTGSIRFDNVVFSGNAIPTPGAVALLALAGLTARRRRN